MGDKAGDGRVSADHGYQPLFRIWAPQDSEPNASDGDCCANTSHQGITVWEPESPEPAVSGEASVTG